MKIKLLNFGGIKPDRAHYNDAGADVFSLDNYVINPGETLKVPLGIGLEIPDGYVGFICPKSGLSSRGLVSELSPIDSGYRGEVHVILHNQSDEKIMINKNKKIGQVVILPVVLAEFTENLDNSRGTGAFGSTGL
ncbi:dUTP pyrophosphatase [Peptoniphilus asaccharolyticus DSM 20463]|uniref:dUTP diphosphatase n=1 Tax=Peptoniphilus asaccharolyticus DSM 20463 TaxID=573058 RepID=A0A1W1V085_PEPAS|nr:deoxyuridine 5'-triphosphate nucleotidohydrolase [Peptoniphilus asaccharolyticus]MBL7575384.1 deoxyuridine 5'-triphosphate nucleotidohydrolase [Peptoniphilus asaccharolyticus]SMB86384.1 dUTP pyrophosphatase [Peptoniphilus asaccharolyticus DSM 20463]